MVTNMCIELAMCLHHESKTHLILSQSNGVVNSILQKGKTKAQHFKKCS